MQQQISSWQIEPETSYLGLLKAREHWEKLWSLAGAKAAPEGGFEKFPAKISLWEPLGSESTEHLGQSKAQHGNLMQEYLSPCFLLLSSLPNSSAASQVWFFFFFFVECFVLHCLASCRGFVGMRIPLPLFVSPELSAQGMFPARQHNEIIISRIWLNVTNQNWSFSDRCIYCFCYLPGHFISIFIFLLAGQSLKPGVQAGLWAGFSLCVHLGSAEQQQHRLRFVHSGSAVRLLHSPK